MNNRFSIVLGAFINISTALALTVVPFARATVGAQDIKSAAQIKADKKAAREAEKEAEEAKKEAEDEAKEAKREAKKDRKEAREIRKEDRKARKKKRKDQPLVEIIDVPLPSVPPLAPPANGSLFSNSTAGAGLVSDFKARALGDLLFVDVVEASEARVESGANRSRNSGTLGGIGTIAGALPLPGAAVAGTVVGALGTRKFEGNGSTSRNSNLQARIAARVIEVLPNGDLRVVAQKLVRINKETETLTLTGIVRPSDVDTNNVVPTTFIGDLRVELNGKGVASADNAPGWLFRLFEKVSPF